MRSIILISTLSLAAASLVGCNDVSGDGSGTGGTGAGAGNNETVEEVLRSFGVDIADTPRVDDDGEPLGDGYVPFGTRITVNKFAEVALFGASYDDSSLTSQGLQTVFDYVPDGNNNFTAQILDDPSVEETPWLADPDIPRDMAAADFDGDGVEETAVVYQELNESAILQIIEDQAQGFTVGPIEVVATQAVDQIVIAAGDFDGDVDEDLVIAFVSAAGVQATFWANTPNGFEASESSFSIPLLDAVPQSAHVVLKTGNIDRDGSIELAVMVNELGSPPTSRYFVYDDVNADFAELASGPAVVILPTEAETAAGADIALGDVDGDAVDEIVFGGLTAIGNTCNLGAYSVIQVLDDARHDLAPLAASKVEFRDTRQPCSSGANHRLTYHPITLPDLDGDRAAEIHGLDVVYEDLKASPGVLTEIYRLPQEDLFTMGTSGSQFRFQADTVSFAEGDVTSDGREDIVFYSQAGGTIDQGLQIWGIDMIDGWRQFDYIETAFENSQGPLHPKLLLPDVDLDQDSMGLSYSEGSYRLVFTEPLVLAALAAAPCFEDAGPAVDDACRTAYGASVTETSEETDSASFIAGVSVGYEVEFKPLGVAVGSAEAILNTRNEARFYGGEAYTLSTSVVRETGVIEDSVIFSTVPLDVYTYTVESHPNPELIGSEIQVRLSRTPITILATLDFYNDNIAEDGLRIDDRIFQHTPGDPTTYPTVGEKDALLRRYRGLESAQVDVGEGSGFTQVSITEFTETIDGQSYDFEATLDLKATKFGVIGGLSLGGGFGFDWSTRKGDETIYQGTVANIAAENFPEMSYSFGLFSYIVDDTENEEPFEVLNYWVVPPQQQ